MLCAPSRSYRVVVYGDVIEDMAVADAHVATDPHVTAHRTPLQTGVRTYTIHTRGTQDTAVRDRLFIIGPHNKSLPNVSPACPCRLSLQQLLLVCLRNAVPMEVPLPSMTAFPSTALRDTFTCSSLYNQRRWYLHPHKHKQNQQYLA